MLADSCFFTNRCGLRLHFLRWGKPGGVPLVLLHGLRAYAQTWDSLVQSLGAGYCIYALDQRGRGLSDWAAPDTYHTQSYVEDLADFVAHVGLQRFVLLGHSLGGANALEYARQHPGRLMGLMIEDIGPGSSSQGDGAARIRREMSQTPLQFENWELARAFWQASRPGLSEQGLNSRLAHSMKSAGDCPGAPEHRADGFVAGGACIGLPDPVYSRRPLGLPAGSNVGSNDREQPAYSDRGGGRRESLCA
jgi:pimeloyl-ACP methyl ester carboxylesterase